MELLKRISIRMIGGEFVRTVKRFPLPVTFSVLTCILLINEIENYSFFDNSPLLVKSIFISILGFLFTLVSTLFLERSDNRDRIKFILQTIVLTLLAYLFITLPSEFRETDYITFASYLSASVFSLMFVYTKNKDESYFGIYNITLFMRGFTSFVFSVILFAGLASSLFAVQHLFFAKNFYEELYGDIWVIIIAFFAPVHFMSGLPDDREPSNSNFLYPKALRILLQYIMTPLVSLYLIILYSYTVKIILTRIWPEGIVSYLIISYSLVGIVTVILLSPLKDSDEFKWINSFSKYFFRALLPLIIVLFMAVMERISQYGVTEKRYFIFVLSLWLAGITLYMVFSKKNDLKLLPVTLSILSVVSLYGPWSCFTVSKNSQLSILEDLLSKNQILVNSEIRKNDASVPFEDRKSISSIISYFYDNHGIDKVEFLKKTYQRLAVESKDKNAKNDQHNFYRDFDKAVSRKMLVKEGLGFDFVDEWQNENTSNFLNISVKYFHDPEIEDISGYDSYIDCRDNLINDRVFDKNSGLYLKYNAKDLRLLFETESKDSVTSVDLDKYVRKIIAESNNIAGETEPEKMRFIDSNDKLDFMILFRNFSANRENEKDPYKITAVYFGIYYKLKPSD